MRVGGGPCESGEWSMREWGVVHVREDTSHALLTVYVHGVTGWCPIFSGLVLSAQEPVKAGSPVGLTHKPPPCSARELKSIVTVSHDQSHDKSHSNRMTSATTDKSVLHTSHERSHLKADELHLSQQPSWKKSLEVQVEETEPPSEVDLQERCSMH